MTLATSRVTLAHLVCPQSLWTMLQAIREKLLGRFAILFLGAIAVVFIFWGIDFRNAAVLYAAKVNGERVPVETVRRAWQDQLSRLQQITRGQLPEELVKAQQQALLDEFVRITLLRQHAEDLGYRTSDALVAETIMSLPDLQVDGKFSRDRYAAALRSQGRTETQFENELRQSLTIGQIQNGMALSSFATPGELERRQALLGEQRQIDYVVLQSAAFADQVEPTEDDIRAWYEANLSRYMTPETVTLHYVELTLDEVSQELQVPPEELQAYYEEVKDRFEVPERRKASHVLIATGEGVDDAAALAEAESVAASAKAGEDFASLAREHSDDPGSAQQGGDLGWATRGMFVGPFEEALFVMQPGEIAGPVKTQFGYHIIRLEEVDPGQVRSFDEVHSELEQDYRRDRAASLFYQRTQDLADEAFASLTELDSVATAMNEPLERIEGFSRQSGGGTFGADPQVIEAAFSDEVLEQGHNSPLVTLGEDRALVLRVSDHRLPEPRPLGEVRDQIAADLRAQKARELAADRGGSALQKLQAGSEWDAVVAELQLEPAGRRFVGRTEAGVPPSVLTAAFAVPHADARAGTVYTGAPLPDGGYAIVAVTDLRSGDLSKLAPSERASLVQQASRGRANAEFSAYIAELEQAADVDRNMAVFQ